MNFHTQNTILSNDLTGTKFGKLTAQWPVGINGTHKCWLCLCECGNLRIVTSSNLKSGTSTSCGCRFGNWGYERHGQTKRGNVPPTYKSWANMVKRCTNTKSISYCDYGGRGITICERWKDYSNFLLDMGPRPDGMTLDRINNEGNYEPSNCCWSTPSQQAYNRRPKSSGLRHRNH